MASQANRPMREQVEFPFNTPVALKLKYAHPKPCANGERAMFSTDDNRVLFLDLDTARQIEDLNIKPGEPILITRQKTGKDAATWLIQRQADLNGQLTESLKARELGQQPDGTFVVPAAPKPPASSRVSVPLADEANTLVDTFAAVLERALKTHEGRVKPDEVRSLLLSAYIQRAKLSSVA